MNPPPCSDHSRIWTIDLALVLLEVLLHTAVLVQSVGFLSRFRLQWLCTEVLMRCHAHYCIRYRYVDILVLSTVPTIITDTVHRTVRYLWRIWVSEIRLLYFI